MAWVLINLKRNCDYDTFSPITNGSMASLIFRSNGSYKKMNTLSRAIVNGAPFALAHYAPPLTEYSFFSNTAFVEKSPRMRIVIANTLNSYRRRKQRLIHGTHCYAQSFFFFHFKLHRFWRSLQWVILMRFCIRNFLFHFL